MDNNNYVAYDSFIVLLSVIMSTRTSVSLRHFRVFLEIVRHGSLLRASQAMNITQSAVSKALRELESGLDTTLLERGRKGVHLTRLGEAFHTSATQCLASFSKAIHAVESGVQKRETLRIGALPTAAGSLLPRAVHRLCTELSEVSVQVYSGSYEYMIGKMRTGALDMVVGRLISRDMVGLSFEKVYDEEISVVCRTGHPLTTATVLTFERLEEFPIIVPPTENSVRSAVEDFFLAGGEKLRPQGIESHSDTFSRVYTLEHDAVWFVPRGTVELDLKIGLLTTLPLHSTLLTAPIGFTTQIKNPLSDIGLAFAQILRDSSVVC